MTTPAQPAPGAAPADLGQQAADTKAHTQQLAQTIAAKVAEGMQTHPEGSVTLQEGLQGQEGTQGRVEGQEGLTGDPGALQTPPEGEGEGEPTPPSPELAQLIDIQDSLLAQGVDIGVRIEDLAPELYEPTLKLLDASHSAMRSYREQASQAEEMKAGYEGLMQRLDQQPEQILLAIALDKPSVMEKVVQIFRNMQEDPEIKERVVREVETAARMAQVDRREAAYRAEQIRDLGIRIESEMSRQCRLKGVDSKVAEEFIAKEIRLAHAENRMFKVEEVASVVDRLRPFAPARKTPLHVNPQRQQRAEQTQQAPIGGQPPAPPAAAPEGRDPYPTHPKNRMRGIVAEAFKKFAGNPER